MCCHRSAFNSSGPRQHARVYLVQPSQDAIRLVGAEQLGPTQSLGVGFAAPQVSVPHPLVVRHGRVEALHHRVGGAGKATPPQLGPLTMQKKKDGSLHFGHV